VDITLHPVRKKKVAEQLGRQGFVSRTSCGICGKELIEDMCRIVQPVTDDTIISVDEAISCVEKIDEIQEYYRITNGSHAVVLFDSEVNVLSFAEDVGRHNALDKVIGKLFLARSLNQARIVALSSRISYELVQKAARAQIPIMISISRPTALAVELGRSLNMTLACTRKKSGLMIFSGEERLDRKSYVQ
jgi:FdhD protein